MSDTPTFGRYAEIPYEQMTPEQQEGYRSLIETRGRLPGPTKIWVHNPKLAKAAGPLGAHFHPPANTRSANVSGRSPSASSTPSGTRPIPPTRMSGAARKSGSPPTRSKHS
jgi:hypothetical protein